MAGALRRAPRERAQSRSARAPSGWRSPSTVKKYIYISDFILFSATYSSYQVLLLRYTTYHDGTGQRVKGTLHRMSCLGKLPRPRGAARAGTAFIRAYIRRRGERRAFFFGGAGRCRGPAPATFFFFFGRGGFFLLLRFGGFRCASPQLGHARGGQSAPAADPSGGDFDAVARGSARARSARPNRDPKPTRAAREAV